MEVFTFSLFFQNTSFYQQFDCLMSEQMNRIHLFHFAEKILKLPSLLIWLIKDAFLKQHWHHLAGSSSTLFRVRVKILLQCMVNTVCF